MSEHQAKTVDEVILEVISSEFFSSEAETAKKIKRRLRYHGLGPYQPELVEVLRRLWNGLRAEVELRECSRYHCGHAVGTIYAKMDDFDITRLTLDLAESYPEVTPGIITHFVNSAVFLYYMR